jgi:hypothetical protein
MEQLRLGRLDQAEEILVQVTRLAPDFQNLTCIWAEFNWRKILRPKLLTYLATRSS